MNQNNQNEIQIIDSSSNDLSQSNRNPRYPLAKDPNASFENSNYKDWLATCEESNVEPLLTEEDLRDALFTSISITSTLFDFLSFEPIVGALNVLSRIIGFLWPNNNTITWQRLISVVEALIDRRATQDVINRAVRQLEGLQVNVAQYTTAFNNWNANEATRNNPALQREVISRFNIADGALGSAIPEFRIEGYELITLTVYAQAANMHLLLLRDAVINGKLWGQEDKTIDDLYKLQVCLIDAYTEHCMSFYRQGLQDLRNRGNWNAFNNYRRTMTITLLDIISLFSNYDARVYPTNTAMQLTREVYTEPNATPQWLNHNFNTAQFNQIENDLIRQPSLFNTFIGATLNASTLFRVDFSGVPVPAFTRFNIRSGVATPNPIVTTGPWLGLPNSTPDQTFNLTRRLNIPENSPMYIFRINSTATTHNYGSQFGNWRTGITRMVSYSNEGTGPSFVQDFNLNTSYGVRTIDSYIPGTGPASEPPTALNYSHTLSTMTTSGVGFLQGFVTAYGWSHKSAAATNRLIPGRTTQFPAVKSRVLGGSAGTRVISGPGHTGGALVAMSGYSALAITFESPSRQRYRLRIRFVKDFNNASLRAFIPGVFSQPFTLLGSGAAVDPNLLLRDFRYVDVPGSFELMGNVSNYDLTIDNPSTSITGTCLIDKIEFIPVDSTTLDYEGKQHLEKAKKAVNNLFTNNGKEALKVDTTDYDVDQAANLVECVPEELYAKEKMILLDEVKHAKQLSESRNLIQNGNFAFYTDKWTTSNNVNVQANNPIFKGNYLNMPGAGQTDTGVTTFPTYIFQKIDESKLKPYTRYKARGFVGSSNEVELIVARYDEEVDAIMNVRNNAPGVPSPFCGEFDRCHPQVYTITHDGCHDDRKEQYADVGSHSCHGKPREKHGICHDSHQFDFHIDTGKVYLTENPGIWVLFKISSPEGYATLDNIELIEEGPLVGESLALVRKREQKWKNEMESKWLQTKEAYEKAKREVDGLFTDSQDKALKFETIISNIISAEHLVQSIPYVYNKWLSTVPGMNYAIYKELELRVAQAYSLYERRNIIKNGDFHHGLDHWHATPHARVEQIGDTDVLVIPNWGSNVSQNLCVEHNRGYVLRVTAKKVDMGKGIVTISDCAKNTETVTFTSCDYVSTESTSEQSLTCTSCDGYEVNESITNQPDYLLNQARNELRCYIRNEITSDQSEFHSSQEMNEQWHYHSNETINGQMNYVTRTIDFFPDTDQVRIDIGETEGIFKVESVELICMEGQ
ncbi:hypothetical protein ICM_06211 [Bacillus cereus BAG1X2-3]|uniref:insecticidal delta-endotoxin Cry8Ea1 family protein n=1 Tax=Bacillus cereus TaxID=1396 RepID=UPI0003308497|nr:insecticidal delta-endotoxin Cry8Ea1 family protein [Bacillus cereus]EOO22988.1 pesticidal crystal protein cry4Ba [Bacillus cereus BAG1X1-1]EOO43879.1 pesticidal crystal protein cry4Ba [Bacillus cereus BAG1X2-2]EOO55910.1 hypothetical protein ICM_06211 [Bacillus cereus BAG1X2-3]EOO99989.1 pesticidal crystal protein cry4Ba [Bacillus cereus BAG2O-1]HDR4539446.1 pesticidal protein [Bacillus cereus]